MVWVWSNGTDGSSCLPDQVMARQSLDGTGQFSEPETQWRHKRRDGSCNTQDGGSSQVWELERSWRWRAACFETIFPQCWCGTDLSPAQRQPAPATEVADRWQPFRCIIWDSMAKKIPGWENHMKHCPKIISGSENIFVVGCCGLKLTWSEGKCLALWHSHPPCPCRGTALLGQAWPQVAGGWLL